MAISRVENGRDPTLETLRKLAKGMGTTEDEILRLAKELSAGSWKP